MTLPNPRWFPTRDTAFGWILLASTGLVTGPVAAEQIFDQAFKHSTSEHRGVAVGDLDGDGTPDVVATNFRGSNITVRFNDGTGHLSPETTYSAGFRPLGVSLGDMDGDGDLDAVVANLEGENISVLLNDGTGVFGAPAFYLAFRAHSLVLGDIDGDDDLDVVVADDGSGMVLYYLNDGDGVLSLEFGPFLGGADSAGDVALGDLDGDGDLDLAVSTRTEIEEDVFEGELLIAFNENGQFVTDQFYATTSNPVAVAIGDVDGDGNLDVAVGGYFVNIFLNQGDGSLAFSESLLHFPTDVQMVDVDGDDDLDLAMAATFGVEVAENIGGTFAFGGGYSTQRVIESGGFGLYIHMTRPWTVAPADMDADGAVDLVAANGGNWVQEPEAEDFFGYISILKNDGAGKYGTARLIEVSDRGLFDGPAFVAMADLDGDGANDLVTANPESNDVTVVLNAAMDEPGVLPPTYPVGAEPTRLAIGDIDGDLVDDLVVANRGDASVSVLRGAPDGTFAAEERFDTFLLPADVALGDLDGDGDLDVAVGHEVGASVSILRNDGNGVLGAYALVSTGTIYTDSIALSDVDDDGALDLVVASHGAYWDEEPSTVSVLRNTGDASFVLASSQTFGLNIVSITVADLDGDGAPDIATLEQTDAVASVLTNVGGGAFGAPVSLPTTVGARLVGQHLVAGDLNLDGALDLVTANGEFSVSALLSDDGSFVRDEYLLTQDNSPLYGTVWEATAVAVGDLDGDGRADLAVADAGIDHVVVTFNASDAEPFCPADIDGDGTVGFNDLAQLLGNWGLCPGGAPTCPADIDGDGTVGFNDLSTLLGTWGLCIDA